MSKNMSQQSIARLCNRYAEAYDRTKAAKDECDAIKAELKELGVGEYSSTTVTVPVREKTRKTLDRKAMESDLGVELVQQYEKATPYIEVAPPQRTSTVRESNVS